MLCANPYSSTCQPRRHLNTSRSVIKGYPAFCDELMDGKRIDLPVALDLQDLLDISGNLFQCLVKVVLSRSAASLNFFSTRASIFLQTFALPELIVPS